MLLESFFYSNSACDIKYILFLYVINPIFMCYAFIYNFNHMFMYYAFIYVLLSCTVADLFNNAFFHMIYRALVKLNLAVSL